MKELYALTKVKQFHDTFNAPVELHPVIPSEKRCDLRVGLLKEELQELEDAIEANDLVEVADAFADIQYVLSGAMLEFGMGNVMFRLFEEVHRSNMSKTCETEKLAIETCHHYEAQGEPCYYIHSEKSNVYLVFRTSDDKAKKSINYSPADLAPILEDYARTSK